MVCRIFYSVGVRDCVCVCVLFSGCEWNHESGTPHWALRALITVGVWRGGLVHSFSSSFVAPSFPLSANMLRGDPLRAFLHMDEQQLSCNWLDSMLLLELWRWPRLSSPPWTDQVLESKRKKERGKLSALYKELVLLMITLADGSYLGSVPQPPRFAAGSLAHTYTHMLFLSLVKCASDSLSLPFLTLFTPCLSLTSSLPLFILLSVLVFYS